MQFLIVLGLITSLLGVVFALQNPGVVVIKFMIWEFHGSLALVLLGTFALGFISSLFVSMASAVRSRLRRSAERVVSLPPSDSPGSGREAD